MHVPPYHKQPTWQRFFAGAFFGAFVSYFILIYMYGTMYENLLAENMEMTSQINDLKDQNEALLQDKEDLSEKSREPLTVSTIIIRIAEAEGESLKMDRLIELQLEEMIKEEINHLVGQEIAIISKSDRLLLSAIENRGFTIEDVTYYFEVKKLTISQELEVDVIPKLAN
ncbi:sporulation membrane protein YtrI [Oceanobacillus damuensis]|uniref:sporulation membrane protein YtrI n=1 Tax=Oceanobacillus damuensis TaxID=937928 RepID=UPI000829AD02|nr:sporulation membrane protein YtrI [Oceanobacillus damuensis]